MLKDRTRKLMEVTRLRDTPILTFMNKLDRDIRYRWNCSMKSERAENRLRTDHLADWLRQAV
ncbi:hypothetical protein ACLB1T_16440 [Escherichia coli]